MVSGEQQNDTATAEKQKSSVKRVPAVRRAAAILWQLAERSTPMNLSQISRAVDVIPSTSLHILRELVFARLVTFDTDLKIYQLGPGILELAQSATKLNNFAEVARPRLQAIANDFNMTATATSKTDDRHLALVAFANPPAALSLNVTLGGRVPLVAGAAGRCFAAFGGLTSSQIKKSFAHVKWGHPVSFADWEKQVAQTRNNGYAEDREAFVAGVSSIGVPVFLPDGSVNNVIGVYAISAQLDAANKKAIITALKLTAEDISRRLSV